jgi:hypothetical protein
MKLRLPCPASLALLLVTSACSSGSPADDELGSGSVSEGGSSEADASTSSGASTDGAESETSGGQPSAEQLCTATCDNYAECLEPLPNCMANCLAQIEQFEPGACQDAELELLVCIGGLSCMALAEFYEGEEEPVHCADQLDNLCYCGITGSTGEACSFEYSCTMGDVYAIECDTTTCTCLQNGTEVATCESADFCPSFSDDVIAGANACCGWDLAQPLG